MSDILRIGLVHGDLSRTEAAVTRCRFDDELAVVWTADRWDAAVELCNRQRPDVLVIDCDLEAEPGPPPGLFHEPTPLRVVLMVSGLPSAGLARYRSLGPYAILLKEDPTSALLLCLKQLHGGLRSATDRPPRPARHVDEGRQLRLDSPLKTLTARQTQILKCLARGDSVKEAAASLALTAKSVTNHKYRIMQKLGVDDRVKLARLAIREGLVEP